MTAIGDEEDPRALGRYFARPGPQFIVDERVGNSPGVVGRADIGRQEDLIEPVEFVGLLRIVVIRLLAAMSGKQNHDLVARFGFADKLANGPLDVFADGTVVFSLLDRGGLRQGDDILAVESVRILQNVPHQLDVVGRTNQR